MNLAEFVVAYGQAIAWGIIVVSVVAVLGVLRRSGGAFPRGVGGWLVLLVAVTCCYGAVQFLGWATAKVDPLKPVFRQAGQPAPDFAFVTVADGAPHTLADYRGKVVVLNLWATWCPPCRAEMPNLDRLQREYGKDGVVVITVSDEKVPALERFPGFAALSVVKGRVDTSLTHSRLFVQARVARPVTHVIDRDGILRETLLDAQDYATFERKVTPYLRPRV
jgi:thiol-disulfide isomerase/thioredoxin